MRTRSKKWTVPIMAFMPVLALAAIVSAGLFFAGGAQTVEAQSACTIKHNVMAPGDDNEQLCTSGVSTFTLMVENGADNALSVYAYVSGGTDDTDVTIPLVNNITGKEGYDLYTGTNLAPTISGGTAGSFDIPVDVGMANDDRQVVVVFYTSAAPAGDNPNGMALTGTVAGSAVITFLTAPVEKADVDDDDTDGGEVVSALVLTGAGIDIANVVEDTDGGLVPADAAE